MSNILYVHFNGHSADEHPACERTQITTDTPVVQDVRKSLAPFGMAIIHTTRTGPFISAVFQNPAAIRPFVEEQLPSLLSGHNFQSEKTQGMEVWVKASPSDL